jgi:hypothetical protein
MKTAIAAVAGVTLGCLLTWAVMNHKTIKAEHSEAAISNVDEYQVLSYNPTKGEWVFLHKAPWPLNRELKITADCKHHWVGDHSFSECDAFAVGETITVVPYTTSDRGFGWNIYDTGDELEFHKGMNLPASDNLHVTVIFAIQNEEVVSRGAK